MNEPVEFTGTWVEKFLARGAGPTLVVTRVRVCGACGRQEDSFLVSHDPVVCLRVHVVKL